MTSETKLLCMHAETWRVLRHWGPPNCGISWHLLSDITALWGLRALWQENFIYPYWGLGSCLRSSFTTCCSQHHPVHNNYPDHRKSWESRSRYCFKPLYFGVLFLVTQKTSGIQGHFSSSLRSSAQVECCKAHTMHGFQLWLNIASKFISCCILKG